MLLEMHRSLVVGAFFVPGKAAGSENLLAFWPESFNLSRPKNESSSDVRL